MPLYIAIIPFSYFKRLLCSLHFFFGHAVGQGSNGKQKFVNGVKQRVLVSADVKTKQACVFIARVESREIPTGKEGNTIKDFGIATKKLGNLMFC